MNPYFPKLCIFDLDGTLADTVPQLHIAVGVALQAIGAEPISIDDTRRFVGNGPYILLARAIKKDLSANLDSIEPTALQVAVDKFNEAYSTCFNCKDSIYDGVIVTLDALYSLGIKMAVVTNKPNMFVEPMLKEAGLLKYFDYTLGSGIIAEKKPDPKPLLLACEYFKVNNNETWMIGDSANDIGAAKALKCFSVGLTYGYNHGKPIDESNPDRVFDDFAKIKDLVLSLC